MQEPELSAEFLLGIQLFNERDFFESHEVLEDIWKSAEEQSRLFYQGLIQAAVGLLHFCNGNTVGARKLYWASRTKLEHYQPRYLGLNVAGLLGQMAACFEELLADPSDISSVSIDEGRIPVIELSPPPIQAASQ